MLSGWSTTLNAKEEHLLPDAWLTLLQHSNNRHINGPEAYSTVQYTTIA